MGCISSKASAAAVEAEHEKEEAILGPPSKTMDASEHAQLILMLVSKTIEVHLETFKLDTIKATQMITRQVSNDQGTMYYIKAQVSCVKWPWIFVKIYEPPTVTDVSPAVFKGMKKMDQDYKLVTF